MAILHIAFGVLLFATNIYAFWKGGWEGRCTCLLLLAAASLGPLALHLGAGHPGKAFTLLILDGLLFAGLLIIMFLSDRYWPLWLAGLHLLAVTAEIVTLVDAALLAGPYEAAQTFWSIPMQVLLAYGVYLDQQADIARCRVADQESGGQTRTRGMGI